MTRSGSMAWRVCALAILLAALALRLYRLEAQSLWYDEGITAGLATRSLEQIALNAADDIHPPLYYWLLSLWARPLGDGVFALRAFSGIAGVALVAAVIALARRLLGPAAALSAGVLTALSPYLVWYSQEVRMYALAALWGVALVWLTLDLLGMLGRPDVLGRLRWIACVAVGVAALHTHYFAGVSALAIANVVAAMGVARWVAVERRADRVGVRGAARFLVTWMLAQAATVVLFVPWLRRAWPTVRDWPALGEPTTLPFLLRESARTFSLGVHWPDAAAAGATVLVALAICGVAAGLVRPPRWGTVVAIGWAATPVALMWLQSLVRPAWNPKFLIVAAPGFEMLAGAGTVAGGLVAARAFERASAGGSATARGSLRRGAGAAALGAVVAVALLLPAVLPRAAALRAAYFDPAYQRDDYRGIVRDISSIAGPGDVVIANAPTQVEMLGYYDRGRHEIIPLPIGRPVDREATTSALDALAIGSGNVHAVLWATDQSDPDGLVESWLNENLAKAYDRWYGNVRLALWARPPRDGDWLMTHLSVEAPVSFGDDELVLFFVEGSTSTVAAGDVLTLDALWVAGDASGPPRADYTVFLHLVDESGALVAQRDMAPRNGLERTSTWTPVVGWDRAHGRRPDGSTELWWPRGVEIRDHMALAIPHDLAAGRYKLLLGVYDPATGERLPVSSMRAKPDGAPAEGLDVLEVATVEVLGVPKASR